MMFLSEDEFAGLVLLMMLAIVTNPRKYAVMTVIFLQEVGVIG